MEHSKSGKTDRKKDHIELALKSQSPVWDLDPRFYYEAMLSGHPEADQKLTTAFGSWTLDYPIWVSSMTGGTEKAKLINHNLARACKEFGLGFGLGSCRSLMEDQKLLVDFDVRSIIGDQLPLFANLGIAQIEHLLEQNELHKISELIDLLKADGLIIHINPMQEFFQPEGDRYKRTPLELVKAVLEEVKFPLIVKEVGQGFGPESLKNLLQLPLLAIEFGAFGGTNFSILELQRQESPNVNTLKPLSNVGHSAEQMIDYCNKLSGSESNKCEQLIISGGVRDFLDGYYYCKRSQIKAIYGQASSFLPHAQGDYEVLRNFIQQQIQGLLMAHHFLRIVEK